MSKQTAENERCFMGSPLKEQLQRLHEELSANPELDEETAELMRKVAEDIEVMELTDNADVVEGLQEYAIRFDQDHPTLSEILRQIVDTLGRIGV
jgi:allophanate hydrolase subunit 1